MSEQPSAWEQYLEDLPPERRDEVRRVWEVVRAHAPAGYVETIGPKFLTLGVGGEWYVALANQKGYISLYLMPVYVFPELQALLDGGGKKLKMGKSCITFKRADDLPLDAIGAIVGATTPEAYTARIAEVRGASKGGRGR